MKTIIIAEAGVNHNGSLEIAKKLIKEAAKAGADYIKFQTYITENLVSKDARTADYQKKNIGYGKSQYKMLKDFELSLNDHLEIVKCCKLNKIKFFSTAFDMESIELLAKLKMPMWKIPSGEITNLPYLLRIGSMNKLTLLSTGMATLGEIEEAIMVLEEAGTSREKIIILHCTTEYPAPLDEVNLKAMTTIGQAFKIRTGYSDHTSGIEISLAAVAMGAAVIEKHFTLDRNMKGPDHKASIEPSQFKKMVDGIRNIELAMGDGIKKPTLSEIKNKEAARKSIIASQKIKSGELFKEENLAIKRPGTGLSPMLWNKVIGSKAKRDYNKDELIEA